MANKSILTVLALVTALCLMAAGSINHSGQKPAPIQAPVPDGVIALPNPSPAFFVENKGQLDARAQYYVKLAKGTAYFTPDAMVYQMTGQNPQSGSLTGARAADRVWNVIAKFEGANPLVRIEGSAEQP